MNTRATGGFTIIEVMLVLGVTGFLIAGLFVGIGTSVGIQRYRDASTSLKSLLQEQYSELSSVLNDRDNTWSCNAAAVTNPGSPEVRGQSECVLVGRLVTIRDDELTLYTVVARDISSGPPPAIPLSDVDSLRTNYRLNVSRVNNEATTLEWGTKIAWPVGGAEARSPGASRELSVLFVRSPDSGQIYTFTSDSAPENPNSSAITAMIQAGAGVPGQGKRYICVDPDGFMPGDKLAIIINSYASGPSAVDVMSNSVMAGVSSC